MEIWRTVHFRTLSPMCCVKMYVQVPGIRMHLVRRLHLMLVRTAAVQAGTGHLQPAYSGIMRKRAIRKAGWYLPENDKLRSRCCFCCTAVPTLSPTRSPALSTLSCCLVAAAYWAHSVCGLVCRTSGLTCCMIHTSTWYQLLLYEWGRQAEPFTRKSKFSITW